MLSGSHLLKMILACIQLCLKQSRFQDEASQPGKMPLESGLDPVVKSLCARQMAPTCSGTHDFSRPTGSLSHVSTNQPVLHSFAVLICWRFFADYMTFRDERLGAVVPACLFSLQILRRHQAVPVSVHDDMSKAAKSPHFRSFQI